MCNSGPFTGRAMTPVYFSIVCHRSRYGGVDHKSHVVFFLFYKCWFWFVIFFFTVRIGYCFSRAVVQLSVLSSASLLQF